MKVALDDSELVFSVPRLVFQPCSDDSAAARLVYHPWHIAIFIRRLRPRSFVLWHGPALDGRLQTTFDPAECAVGLVGIGSGELQDQIGGFFGIVAACCFDPLDPL